MELLNIILDTITTAVVGIFLVMLSFLVSLFILKVYTKIDFEKSLYSNSSDDDNDIPNTISIKFITTVFAGVFMLMGISFLSIFSVI